jgi:hypothetical protein
MTDKHWSGRICNNCANEYGRSSTLSCQRLIGSYETGNDKKSPPNGKETVYNENSIFSEEMNKWQCQ